MTATAPAGRRFRGAPVDLLIDVRSRLEFWTGHLPDAVCIPVDRLPDALDGQPGVSRASRLVVYCASGARSAAATAILKDAGYTNVVDGGGIASARRELSP